MWRSTVKHAGLRSRASRPRPRRCACSAQPQRAGGVLGLVVDLAARQAAPAAAGAWAVASRPSLARWLRPCSISAGQRRQIGVDGLFEQALLLGVEALGCGRELQPLEHRHLVGELVDDGLLERDLASCWRRRRSAVRTTSRSCCASSVSRSVVSITEGDRAGCACAIAHQQLRQLRGRYSTRDDAGLADALPGQAQHQGIELRAGQRQRAGRVLGPDELAAVQPARRQPHADAVVHQHLHAVGAPVGEQVGMVRPGGAEDVDHPGQRRLGARRACPAARRPATPHRPGSPQQLARPGGEVGRGARPAR